MKKTILLWLALATATAANAQSNILPGKGRIDVEKLNKNIDMGMDIAQLNIYETRVLRNAFAARQGYLFKTADLRGVFQTTSWYDELMNKRWEMPEKMKPISYTDEEMQFINRLKAHEEELKKLNFKAKKGELVNMDNLMNPYQVENMDAMTRERLGKNGFVVIPSDQQQLFHVYEMNDYSCFPSFVTTDLYMQIYHMYFDCTLRDIEETKFVPLITTLTKQLYNAMNKMAGTATAKEVKEAAKWNTAYFAIAHALITGGKPLPVDGKYAEMVKQEIKNNMDAEIRISEFLEYTPTHNMPMFGYNTHRPRGHYTRSEALKRYFRSMMWLQNVPFGTDKENQLKRALLMAQVIGDNRQFTNGYRRLADPISFLLGKPDNVSILQVYEEMKQSGYKLNELLEDKAKMKKIRLAIEQIANKQTRIKPKFLASATFKINLMPQRYMPDAEVLQEMVDYDSKKTKRGMPKGLDVMASMGIVPAEKILLEELNEQGRWNQYKENLGRMKKRMNGIDWQQTVANLWMAGMKTLCEKQPDYPYFMQTAQWDKKNLNAALAAWAELKHDAILYAKQPMGAECGGLNVPNPIVKGYVEPNVKYWNTAIGVLDALTGVLEKYDLVTEKAKEITETLRENAEFLLNMSQKELNRQTLTDEEYEKIRIIGSDFEYMTLQLISQPDQYLDSWDLVNGPDKSIAIVADVYTANASNNPEKAVLYEAVGPAHMIYVVVEIDGYLYLTRGAVLSYREFDEDLNTPRLTDEEWQKTLEEQPGKGTPSWMQEIMLPADKKPVDNERIFYSSGC
ncbi:MAG: DUF3160 domain-containing protein [Prevotella sp.]|nr:DUF3160 domain-containing protein [Prevotella sp.]